MDILGKIQNLPESQRKIILWSVVIVIGLALLTFYAKNVQKRFKSFEGEKMKEELRLPQLQEELKGLPKIEMPKIDEEELKKLEEMMKKTQE